MLVKQSSIIITCINLHGSVSNDVFCNLSLGHYVPQLAELMLQFNKKEKLFNLKGIAVS